MDTFPTNLDVFSGDTLNNNTYESFKNPQPISFTQDSCYNAMLFSVPANRILVNIKQGETGRNRHLTLFSNEFWSATATKNKRVRPNRNRLPDIRLIV